MRVPTFFYHVKRTKSLRLAICFSNQVRTLRRSGYKGSNEIRDSSHANVHAGSQHVGDRWTVHSKLESCLKRVVTVIWSSVSIHSLEELDISSASLRDWNDKFHPIRLQ